MMNIWSQEAREKILDAGFWFVDIPRTSSSSIQNEICMVYGPELHGRKTGMLRGRSIDVDDHTPAILMREMMGDDVWNGIFTFSMVRNPWDRIYSVYRFRQKYSQDIPLEMPFSYYAKWMYAVKRGRQPATWGHEFLFSSTDYITGGDDRCAVRFVGRFEEREKLFEKFNSVVRKKVGGESFLAATSESKIPYQERYDKCSRDIIHDLFQDDVENFMYSFEQGALPGFDGDQLKLKRRSSNERLDGMLARTKERMARPPQKTDHQFFRAAAKVPMGVVKKAVKKGLGKVGLQLVRRSSEKPKNDPAEAPCILHELPKCDQDILRVSSGFTMTSIERQLALIAAVRYVVRRKIPGCFVECGVWRGGSSMIIAMVLAQEGTTDRDLYLFDTFEGMPPPTDADKSLDGVSAQAQLDADEKGEQSTIWCVAGIEDVRANMASVGYPMERIHLVKGPVEQTIPKHSPGTPIALLRLDTDWYESTKHEMEQLFPMLETDGVLIIDDYGHWQGARKAIDEFLEKESKQYLMHPIDYTGRILIKN